MRILFNLVVFAVVLLGTACTPSPVLDPDTAELVSLAESSSTHVELLSQLPEEVRTTLIDHVDIVSPILSAELARLTSEAATDATPRTADVSNRDRAITQLRRTLEERQSRKESILAEWSATWIGGCTCGDQFVQAGKSNQTWWVLYRSGDYAGTSATIVVIEREGPTLKVAKRFHVRSDARDLSALVSDLKSHGAKIL